MNIEELVKYLKEEIKKCETNSEVYRKGDLSELWALNNERTKTLKEILDKIKRP